MAKDKVKFESKKIDDLVRSLKKDYVLKVGIIGSKAKTSHDKDSGLTNAEVGSFHEFGLGNMPKRSFLEMPVREKIQFNQDQWKKIKKNIFNKMFVQNKAKEVWQDLGEKCVSVIMEAFDSNGFGQWAPWSTQYTNYRMNKIKSKKKREIFWSEHNILVDSGKLRNSITYKVTKKNDK